MPIVIEYYNTTRWGFFVMVIKGSYSLEVELFTYRLGHAPIFLDPKSKIGFWP